MRAAQAVTGLVGVALGACLLACTASTARLPRMTFGTPDDRFETKMLRPAARTSVCRTTLLGIPVAGPQSPGQFGRQIRHLAVVADQGGEPLAFPPLGRGTQGRLPLEDADQVAGHPHLMLQRQGGGAKDLAVQQIADALKELRRRRSVLHGVQLAIGGSSGRQAELPRAARSGPKRPSVALDFPDPLSLPPPLDIEMVTRWPHHRQLKNFSPKQGEGTRRRGVASVTFEGQAKSVHAFPRVDQAGLASDLHVPIRHLLVDGRVVKRESSVLLQVGPLAGSRHHAEPQLAVGEQRLDAADPG